MYVQQLACKKSQLWWHIFCLLVIDLRFSTFTTKVKQFSIFNIYISYSEEKSNNIFRKIFRHFSFINYIILYNNTYTKIQYKSYNDYKCHNRYILNIYIYIYEIYYIYTKLSSLSSFPYVSDCLLKIISVWQFIFLHKISFKLYFQKNMYGYKRVQGITSFNFFPSSNFSPLDNSLIIMVLVYNDIILFFNT